MRRRYHLPALIDCRAEIGADEKARLQRAVSDAIRRAVESSSSGEQEIVAANSELQEKASELFSFADYSADRETYAVPSYDDGGRPHEVPVKSSPANNKAGQSMPAASKTSWSADDITAHIMRTFGTTGPHGQTFYGVQTPQGVVYADTKNGQTTLTTISFHNVKKDVEGHWQATNTVAYPKGRFTFTVTGKAEGDDPPHPNVGFITDFQGNQYGGRIYSSREIGYQLVFDVPETIQPGKTGQQGSPHGTGILPGGSGLPLILFRCDGYWDTSPLTDPAFAGASDDDYWRLFLNLCNSRALDNLQVSETYVRKELVPRYLGANGSTSALSDYSRHNVQHFQEDLQLLRGLLLASNQLWTEIHSLEKDLDPLIMTHHRSSRQYRAPLSFGAGMTAEVFWPIYHEPREEDRPKVEWLREQLREKGQSARIVMAAILKLVQKDPFLTQFISGLELSGNVASAPNRGAIASELADVPTAEMAQQQILKKLDGILLSIAKARHKLCRDPERILDVPLVYEAVQKMVHGVNPRFDEVVRSRIAKHQRQQAWIDIGLSAIGIVLFVGGLIISLAGGPAGLVLFLEVSGTVLGAVAASRSIDKAEFFTSVANASVVRGGGMVTLEAAADARFWAKVDAVLLAVDAGLQSLRLARAASSGRKAEALAKLAKGADKFNESAEAARYVPFEELLKRATPHGKLPINQEELSQLQEIGSGFRYNQTVGRIAEEAAERAISSSGEYVQLATLFKQGNLQGVGIDLLYVRRRVFEDAFGRLANPRDASKVLVQATEQQRQQFFQALRKSANPEDLISFEVKFSRAGKPVEELLGEARGGIQQNSAWYRGLMTEMMKAADPNVQATGRLLSDIIGSNAQDLGRLSRIGIVMDASGAFSLTRLNDEIINLAQQSKTLWNSANYQHRWKDLLKAENAGQQAKAQRFRALLTTLNTQIDALDAAVRQSKQAEIARQRAFESMRRVHQALDEVSKLSVKPQTPAIISSLHLATSVARLHMQVVRQSAIDADADFQRATATINEANSKYAEFEKAINAALEEL